MKSENVSPDHPIVDFFFLVYGNPTKSIMDEFEELLDRLQDREWSSGPPELVDYVDEYLDAPEEERFIHIFGGKLGLYSTYPPWGARLPIDVDKRQFEEVNLIIQELCQLSQELNCAFSLELDHDQMGFIREGKPDEAIQLGLLDPWREHLENQ